VSATDDSDADGLVLFGDHRLQVEVHLGGSSPEAGERLARAFGAVGGAGSCGVVDESWREEVVNFSGSD
jgi:hypothetical protein